MMYSSFKFGSAPSNLPITLCDLNERSACLMSMLLFTFSAIGRKFFEIADFLSVSKSWPQSASRFLATSTAIHERDQTASMFLFGLSSSKFSLAQLDLMTCDAEP